MTKVQMLALAAGGDVWQELATQGRFWWFRPSARTFHATTEYAAPQEGDMYCLDASDAWLSQFGGDWQALADFLAPMMGRLDTLGAG